MAPEFPSIITVLIKFDVTRPHHLAIAESLLSLLTESHWSLAEDSSQSRPFLAWSFPDSTFFYSQLMNYIPYFHPHKLPIPPSHLWLLVTLHSILHGRMQP
uniref:Uncharacterized protein n=1 Tax=Micrurus surinamensis TaxID=129470 RepID=A0A2D4PMD4_MICSU